MKLDNLYRLIIERGKNADPRGAKEVDKELSRQRTEFKKLSDKEKASFDQERLNNPYTDTRILNGSPDKAIKSMMVGIDIDVAELLLADWLSKKGKMVDLVMSHHPSGRAYANFYEVMHMQADILSHYGVPINVAEGILEDRIKQVERKVMPVNHNRAFDAAQLLDMAFMCVHTPADNHVATFLQKLMDSKKPERVGDIVDILSEIPEYKDAVDNNNAPRLITGGVKKRAGRIFVDMTGGTEGSVKVFEKLSQAGVGTIIGMHMSEEHRKNAEKFHINVVVAGHISSDSLGLNLILDEVRKKDRDIKIIPCSGFRRFERLRK
ncbi:MAG: NGG1p interacting factor NIF3 [bacterium]